MQVALGHKAGELVVVNASLVNVYTGEILSGQSVVSSGKWIAYVGPYRKETIGPQSKVIDAAGKFLMPGLIDGHTHLALFFQYRRISKVCCSWRHHHSGDRSL